MSPGGCQKYFDALCHQMRIPGLRAEHGSGSERREASNLEYPYVLGYAYRLTRVCRGGPSPLDQGPRYWYCNFPKLKLSLAKHKAGKRSKLCDVFMHRAYGCRIAGRASLRLRPPELNRALGVGHPYSTAG